jgi:Resolvase, N terminal domain
VSLAAAFVRVSTGSQDETSQVRVIEEWAGLNGVTVVKTFRLHGYSASRGMQEPALREAIADMARGDYSALVVTESSRLDRREDLDAQAEILLGIRSAGGDVVSIAEPQFGKTDFAGRIVTLVAQHANAKKSRTVRQQVYRAVRLLRDNNGFAGSPPVFWETRGERYAKQAYCASPDAVRHIYERVAADEPQRSVGLRYPRPDNGKPLYPQTVAKLVRFAANHTGVIECRYTHEGLTETWTHEVTPVVGSSLWWRANRVLDANQTEYRRNKGGRPVSRPSTWVTGVLDCPGCGEKLYVNAGITVSGKPRTPKLRCHGNPRQSLTCGRFKPVDARPVTDLIAGMFAGDDTPVLAFQRVAGNAHELDALHAGLRKIQARLSATEDDEELDALVAERKEVKARIEAFEVVPDSYDYAPTGQTVAQMWATATTR